MPFNNEIVKKGQCGWANSGLQVFVHNNDTKKRYRITVRQTCKYQNIDGPPGSWTKYTPYVMEAGEMKNIGCTNGP